MSAWKIMNTADRIEALRSGATAKIAASKLAQELGTTRSALLGFAFRHMGGYSSGLTAKDGDCGRPASTVLTTNGGLEVGEHRIVPLHKTGRLFSLISRLERNGQRFEYEIDQENCCVWRVV